MNLPEPTERRAEWRLLPIFILLSLAIVVGGNFYYRHYERQFRAAAEHQLAAIAELKASELMHYRKERLEDASIFFNNAAFSGLVRRWFERPEDGDAQRQILEWTDKLRATDQYDLVRLLDAQGIARLSSPAGAPPVSSVVLQHIPEVLRSGQMAFQDFHRNEHDQRVYLDILIPFFNEQDGRQPLGVFYLRINPEKYLYPFLQHWPVPSQTAETLLVRRDGNDALFLNELKFRTNTALNLRIPLENTNVPAVKAVLGQEGVVECRDYRGAPVLAALRAVPDSPWFLVARMDTAEVFAPLRAQLWEVIVMTSVLLFGTWVSVGLIWRQQQARFYRAQCESAEALRKSSEMVQLLLNSTAEAIYGLDMNGLCTFNNAACLKILGYERSEQLLGKNMHEMIHSKHADGTPYDIADCPMFKAFKSGEKIHVDNEVLWRRDGTSFFAEYWSYPVRQNGKLIGAVVTFVDTTERMRAEEKLRQLSRAVEQNPASIVITNPAGDIEYVNPKFVNITGYTLAEALGKNPRILKSGDKSPEAYRELWETITAGKEWRGEFHNKKKNGELYWESASISPIRDLTGRITHFVAVKEDITGRKQTEAERDHLIQELQNTLAQVNLLSGLLPICASCKKIRDDKGYWSQVESYIQRHSEVTFTHGLCPDCIKKLYPELAEDVSNDP